MSAFLLLEVSIGFLAITVACGEMETPSAWTIPSPPAIPELLTPTATAAQTSVAIAPLVLLEEGSPVVELGYYVVEVATGKLWRVGEWNSWDFAWSPDGKTLGRSSYYGRIGGLDLIDLEKGSALRVLSGDIWGIAWSPDSRKIAFTRYVRGPYESGMVGIYVINTDGSGLKQVSDRSWVRGIEWSPRGERIAFQAWSHQHGHVHLLMNLSGDEIAEIWGIPSPVHFAWSPDGSVIAFFGHSGFYLYDVDAGSFQQVTSEPYARPSARPSTWSPDGSKILLYEPLPIIPSFSRISVFNVKGLEYTWTLPEARSPSWSPDGEWIAYLSEGCSTNIWDIYAVRPDGTSEKRLTNTPKTVEWDPRWSPVDYTIAFSTLDKLMLVDADSGNSRTLAVKDPRLAYGITISQWSSDGRYIAFTVGGGRGLCD